MRIIKIGKDNTNDIDFKNDPTVSRYHCQIFVDDQDNKFLTDLNSTNGTFVNGNKISEPVLLTSYDIVRAGNSLVNWKDFLMNSQNESESLDQLNSSVYKKKEGSFTKTKKTWWIIIIIILSVLFIIQYNSKEDSSSFSNPEKSINDNSNDITLANEKKKKEELKTLINENIKREDLKVRTPRPNNGYSPYDKYFGEGVYNKNDSNYIEINNQTNSDAVILLVDANSEKKIRNEFIRKKTKFRMTDVPDGVYYIRSMMGNDWDPKLQIGPLMGGFKTNRSISGNSDVNDRMIVGRKYKDLEGNYYRGYTQTLHGVVGGDVESESLTNNEFAK